MPGRVASASPAHDHTEFYVEPKHALELVPRLADWSDEPFADSSQIPTLLVSELTRQHVTVALSATAVTNCSSATIVTTGGAVLRVAHAVPRRLHRPLAAILRALPPDTWSSLFQRVPFLPQTALAGDKLQKIATLFDDFSPDAIYRSLVSQWLRPQEIAAAGREPPGPIWDASIAADFPELIFRMQFLDLVTYLPDDILTKVDRATMAFGLEGRVPLLDHRVVAHSWTLPSRFKIRGGESKWLLRRVLDRYVPRHLIDRPKMGFAVPIGSWLRGPLRDWAETLLAADRLASDGLLRVEPVRRAWKEHLAGTRNWQHQLWTVLMLQAWRERWV